MRKHVYCRLGLGTVVTAMIMLSAVAILGTAALVLSKQNFILFKTILSETFTMSSSISQNYESAIIENVVYDNSTQQFRITLTNNGNIGISLQNVTLVGPNGPRQTDTIVINPDSNNIVVDNPGTTAYTTTSSTLIFPLTVGSHNNEILIVTTGAESTQGTPAATTCHTDTVTYGGRSLTWAAGYDLEDNTGNNQCDSIWYLLNPPNGTANIVITKAGTVVDNSGGAFSLYNVAQQAPESTAFNSNIGFTSISTSIATQTNMDYIIEAVGSGNAGSFTPGSGQTKMYEISGTSSAHSGLTKLATTANTYTLSETQAANRLVQILAAFRPDCNIILPRQTCTVSIPYHSFIDPVSLSVTTSRGNVFTTNNVPTVSWYNNQWQFRKAITIDNTKVASPLYNFTALISITDTDLKNNAQSTGNDILFTDSSGTTLLNYERENYVSSTGALTAWVKIPVLYTSPKNVIYMYYGNSGAADSQNVAGTWNSNYTAVYHLASYTNPIDSTSNGNNLTPTSMTSGDLVSCQIGNCLNFDGSTKYLSKTSSLTGMPANNARQTGSFWFWVSSNPASGSYQDIYSLQNSGTPSYLQTGFRNGPNSAAWKGSGTGTSLVSTSTPTASQWHYFVYTYNATAPITNKLYIDGVLQISSSTATDTGAPNALYVGKYSGGQFFNGKIDELRISKITMSANWIATEYNNQASPSTFYTIGPVEKVTDARSQ